MCKQTNPQATTARINRLKLKVKQLRATRDELKAIADRLVELHEDLIMEKAKMEKAKDEARSQVPTQRQPSSPRRNRGSDVLACRRDIVSQKDAEITRLTDVVRRQDAVQDEMTAKVCKLENELLSVRTEELKATPMASEDAVDYTLLDSETTLHSDDAHDEATLDKNEEESSSVPFNKTLSCGKLETIPEGSDVGDLECVHQPPPPQPRGRMPPPSVMKIRARLNSSWKATQTEEIARLECHVCEEEAREQTTKMCKVDAQKATSLIQADDLKAYNVVELETNESKAYHVVVLQTNESKSDVEHHEETKMCAVKKSRNKKVIMCE
ncbi:unnamed protein product [Aphanomyces euteiches]